MAWKEQHGTDHSRYMLSLQAVAGDSRDPATQTQFYLYIDFDLGQISIYWEKDITWEIAIVGTPDLSAVKK